tara:strand:+ start:514 stop:699 length:186 start_codon:yes stop_codon:yes gene_type:complete
MKNEKIREIRMQEFVSLQVMRTRYDRLLADAKHAEAAVVKGQISRQCGKLDGIDQVLEVLQ